jgi:cell wall-associated NlpC family hydrolase
VRADSTRVLRPVLLSLLAVLALAAPASAATSANWDRGAQRTAMRAGLLSAGTSFGAPLSAGEARDALAALAVRLGLPAVDSIPPASRAPTVESFDRALVQQLGLADVAAYVRAVAKAAGLAPPGRFGTEVVARYLGLRFNHPAADDRLELFPTDPITRAEAAWSLAQLVGPDVGWRVQATRDTLSTFALPAYTAAQRQALAIAVSRIGFPYVWGGEADTTFSPLTGPQLHGGFDCSGFVWRVFKLSGLPAGARIGGRTAAQMAGEIRKRDRIALADVAPADILFFGSAGFRSRATEANVDHAAIALSPEWAINSSSQGVYVLPLTSGWLHDSFTWARRVL